MGLFGGDPTKEARKTLAQIPGQMHDIYDPYITMGQEELGNLQGQYGQMTSDPGQLLNQLGSGFHDSPGYQFALQQALQGAGHAAAAGGMAGSPMHEQQNMQLATNLGNQYYNNYLKNVLGLYGMGIHGEQGIGQMGYNASSNLARAIADALGSTAKLQYSGDAAKNQGMYGLLGAGIGAAGELGAAHMMGPQSVFLL